MQTMADYVKGKASGFKIESEEEFYAFIKELKETHKINEAEHDALENFVCGIFDNMDLESGN